MWIYPTNMWIQDDLTKKINVNLSTKHVDARWWKNQENYGDLIEI